MTVSVIPQNGNFIQEAKECASNCIANLDFHELEYAKIELKKAIALLKANL